MRGRPRSWRREATGTRGGVRFIWGDETRQVALGYFADILAGVDSLLLFQGVSWRAMDVRSDTARLWWYRDGAVLPDGALIVAGRECRSGLGECRGLLASSAPGSSRWVRASADMPEDVEFVGVVASAADDIWLIGRGTCAESSCLYHMVRGRLDAVGGIGGGKAIGVAIMRGQVFVLTESGGLWTFRQGSWGVLGDVPSSKLRGFNPDLGYWSLATMLGDSVNGLKRAVSFGASITARGSCAVLDGRGSVWHVVRRHGGELSAPALIQPVRGSIVGDIAGLGGDLVAAVGPSVLRWRGRWQAMASDVAPTDSIIALASGDGQVGVALSREAVFRWDSVAQRWRQWHRLPDGFGGVSQIAVARDGAVAVVAAPMRAAAIRENGVLVLDAGPWVEFDSPVALLVLDNYSAVFSFPTPEDPLLGGQLVVTSSLMRDPVQTARIPAPEGTDVFWLGRRGPGRLWALGSGWSAHTIDISRLPLADTAQQARSGAARDSR